MALEPKTSHTHVQPLRQFICSTAQKQNVSRAREYPPATSTNELVHMFLLSGNSSDHRYPITRLQRQATANPAVLVFTLRFVRSQMPARQPMRVVPIAGRSLRRPSGSRTL